MSAERSRAPVALARAAPRETRGAGLVESLRGPGPIRALEFRPPPRGLSHERSVDAWIDLGRTVRALLSEGRYVLFTDDAVGDREEESLQHLTANLGEGADLSGVIPFLTLKHSLEYCLLFARRVASHGLGGLTVTGGDPEDGVARCVPRSKELRQMIRDHVPGLPLGAWVNPHADPVQQAELLLDPDHEADYFLTQVVSHHDLTGLKRFLEEADRRGVTTPGLVGVFFYRSENPATLERLANFIPVPARELNEEFARGMSPDEICARTLRELAGIGADRVYISNLAVRRAAARLQAIEALA